MPRHTAMSNEPAKRTAKAGNDVHERHAEPAAVALKFHSQVHLKNHVQELGRETADAIMQQ